MNEAISMEISTDPNNVYDRIFLIKNPLAIDEIIVQVQQMGARAVISITPVYCKFSDYNELNNALRLIQQD